MDVSYTLVRSRRKTMAIHITPEGRVEVRCPLGCSRREAEAFVVSKEHWIRRHLDAIAQKGNQPSLSAEELQALAAEAGKMLPERAGHYARIIGVSYGRITIRSQKTRWGSCSAKGNLNFNCLLMLMPQAVRDYVVIHELCHRKHLNHSAAFWAEVERYCPDYRTHRKWLKDNGGALISRLP